MTDPSDEDLASLVAGIADEFVARQKRGEQPDVEEYAARHPANAATLRRVLAALRLVGPDLPIGTLGDFRLVREVGRGGMGVVYEAEQLSLKRTVALKVLPLAATLDPRRLQRFQNEALAAAGLHHDHVVAVHAVGCDRGVHYYAMHFVEGRTLAEVVAARRDATPSAATSAGLSTVEQGQGAAYYREVARVGAEAAEALEHAHARGVLHRDVKPANLMLDRKGKLWVTDFGLARLGSEPGVTVSGDLLGTLRYASPEQALAKHGLVDHRTDVYSLGATLYELLTLEPAVTGRDREAVLRTIAFAEPVALRRLVPALPVDLETVVLKALAKEPADRYATAQALAADLRRFLRGLPVEARRPGVAIRATRWVQRHAGLTLAVAGAAVFAAVAVAAGALYVGEAGQARTQRFYRLLFEMKERQAIREPGWTWGNLAAVEQAAAMPDAAENQAELRSLAAKCLGAADVRRSRAVAEGFRALQVAFRPDGAWLALVQGIGDGTPAPMLVRRFDPATWEELPALTFPSQYPWKDAKGRGEASTAVAFSADSRWLAVGTRAGWVHVWDVSQSALAPQSWRAFAVQVERLAFGPGGKELFGLSRDGVPERWQRTHDWVKAPFREQPKCRELRVIPPERVLFVRDDGWFYQVDGDQFLQMHHDWIGAAACLSASPDGRILIGQHDYLRPLDLLTDVEGLGLAEGERAGTEPIAFSPDGRLLAQAMDSARGLRIWDGPSGRLEFRVPVPKGMAAVAFSPDGRWLVVAAQERTVVHEVARRSEMEVAAPQGAPVRDVAFTPGGDLVCRSATHHPAPKQPATMQEVTVWPASDPAPLQPSRRAWWTGGDEAHRLAVAGDRLLCTLGKRLRYWDLRTGRAVDLPGTSGQHGGLAADGRGRPWLASHHQVLRRAGESEPLRPLWENPKDDQQAGHSFYSMAAGRRWALAGRRDGRVYVFPVEADHPQHVWHLSDSPVTALALAADESRVLVGTELGQLFLVEIPSGEILRELPAHHGPTTGVAVAGDLLVTGSADRTFRLWSKAGDLLLTVGVEKAVERLAVSADGTRLAVAVEGERAVRLWHLDRLAARLDALGLPLKARMERAPAAPLPPSEEPPRQGSGLMMEILAGHSGSFPLARVVQRQVDYRRAPGSPPPHGSVGDGHYTLRWSGWLKAPAPGDYNLSLHTRHPVRVWLDDRLVLGTADKVVSLRGRVTLTARPHALRVEYAQGELPAECSLLWSRDGHQDHELVPPTAFFLDRASAERAAPPGTVRAAYAVTAPGSEPRAEAMRLALDAAGNCYVLGSFHESLDLGDGQPLAAAAGKLGTFLAAYDPAGKLLWSRGLTGNGDVFASGLAVSAAGEVHLAGQFEADLNLTPGGRRIAAGRGSFVWKLTRDGKLDWTRSLGGAAATALALDSRGGVCVTGNFAGRLVIDGGPRGRQVLRTQGSSTDLFVWKQDPHGRFLWAHRLGGARQADNARGQAIACDADDGVVVGGDYRGGKPAGSWDQPLAQPEAPRRRGVVLKLDAAGRLVWCKDVSAASGGVQFGRLALDAAGGVYALAAADAAITHVGEDPVPSAGPDVRSYNVIKLTADGRPVWVRPLPASTNKPLSRGFALDRQGDVLIGYPAKWDDLDGMVLKQPAASGGVVLRLRGEDGRFARVQRLGADVVPQALALDAGGAVFAAGRFAGVLEADPEPGKARRTSQGTADLFLLKLVPGGPYSHAR